MLKDTLNILGWHTKRKLVIIESDDWGSVRMPSREVFYNLIENGIDLFSDGGLRYNKNDSLATESDLSALFEVLASFKDHTGRSPSFTPVSVVANPDFDSIEKSGFAQYIYEPFTQTLKKYKGCENSFSLWIEGIEKRLFVPQFHGREHLNIPVWIRALQNGNKNVRLAFDNRMWGISTTDDPLIRIELQAAFDFIDVNDIEYQKEVISDGLNLFEELFGYRASLFVPPNGFHSSRLEKICVAHGIRYISVPKLQEEPIGNGNVRRRLHWLGKRNQSELISLIRNCFFEPGDSSKEWTGSCLSEIATAFKWHKPAVISSHRVNYVGALYKGNRDRSLRALIDLIKGIQKNWPDVEFVTTEELGRIITND